MLRYFERKIGQPISRTAKTGNKSVLSSIPYGRQYHAEVLDTCEDGKHGPEVLVSVTSTDIHPSGMLAGGTHVERGDVWIFLNGVEGLGDFWRQVLKSTDPPMVHYI